MLDLGLDVLFKGKNMARLLGGLWVALRISLLSVAISIPLGILLGVLMSGKNPVVKAILRVYLEIIRIMPQMVLLFPFTSAPPVPLGGTFPARWHPSSCLCCGAPQK